MKIVAINKTLNEERFIADYCKNHSFCDLILIADGGSSDSTIEIAKQYDNVRVKPFEEKVELSNGSFMNPEPKHTNFLLDWADEEKADWILFTGCDTWPNVPLQEDIRRLLEWTSEDGLYCTQIYFWGEDQYFPKINEAGPSLWAFRGGLGFRFDESRDTFFNSSQMKVKSRYDLNHPYALLHYYGDEKRTAKKLERYASWGYPQTHPLESIYAPPEVIPDWLKETIPE